MTVEPIVDVLDRRYAFASQVQDDDRFVLEAARFVEWLFAEDLVRPHALQLLDDDREQRQRFQRCCDDHWAEARQLRKQLCALYPDALAAEAAVLAEDDDEHGPEYHLSLRRFDVLAQRTPNLAEEQDDLDRTPERDPSAARDLIDILSAKVASLRLEDNSKEQNGLHDAVRQLERRHAFRFKECSLRLQVSSARSLRHLLDLCRALNPPPEGTADWMPFHRYEHWTHVIQAMQLDKGEREGKTIVAGARVHLERVYEEIRAMLGATLSANALVLRFKERCTWFDKDRMRAIAEGKPNATGVREDRLTLELARYLHDHGVFPLVRCRMANLEPDVISPFGGRRFAVESKVYAKRAEAKRAVLHGFWQLHGYLTALQTKTVRAHEGFLVVFRLGGAVVDVPSFVPMNSFAVHIVVIDLAKGESGHKQPQPIAIGEDEFVAAAAEPTAKASTRRGRPRRARR